jgi:arylsulfatase A-like enzyme
MSAVRCILLLLLIVRVLPAGERPNIVLILADDFGYGDAGCYNARARVATPHIDRIAQQGLRFTDAHSPATVCTPTRYGLLTGQMPFRVPRGGTVFTGAGGPSLISPGRTTLASLLRQHGYATWAVGKWHLGLTFQDAAGQPIHDGRPEAIQRIDFSKLVEGGPLAHGFDRFFGTACCPTTDWLYAFIDGDRIPVPPTMPLDKSGLPRHPYANDCRAGMIAANFPMQSVDQVFLERSRQLLEQHLDEHPDQPFFLYHSTQAVHLPSFASSRFQGQSGAGPHGDFLLELDDIVGQLTGILERRGVLDRTLFIFTSDNGPETSTVVSMRTDHRHDGAAPWRGMKRDNWEGGHRVPLLVRWPGVVAAGTETDQLASLTDVLATVADIVGEPYPSDTRDDSFSLLPVLKGEAEAPIRPYLVTQAFRGAQTLAIRRGSWKYIAHAGSGGNNYQQPPLQQYALPETVTGAQEQLYNLASDPGETTNLIEEQTELAAELRALLAQVAGRNR